jgi:pimeloyl-ACP methyl ester carboxylesterase
MKRQVTATSLLAIALLAAGCGGGGNGDVGPTNTASGNGNPGGATPPPSNPTTAALFQPLQGVLPFPTDIYFSGSTDATLNIQPANALMPLQSGLNALDGFSTSAVIRTRFASPLDPASLTATSVVVVQVTVDSATKATTGVTRKLVLGTDPATADFSVGLATDAQVGSTILEIRPLKPLVPSAGPGATNVGYLVLLTNGIRTAAGAAVTPDDDYGAFKGALPTCAAITNTSLNGLCRLTGAHLQIAGSAPVGVNPANVVLSFSFSTQATRDTMNALANPGLTTARPIVVQNTGATTQAISTSLPGHANIFVGTFTIPYYLTRPTQANPTAPLTQSWQGNPSPLDATSRLLTRFNPVPVATETIQIPLFVTVPNAQSPGLGARPPNGWPAIIFQHGLTRNRLDAAAIADAAADGGNYVVVSIDLPLHGIPGATATGGAFYQAANERTFNLDLVNNTTLAQGPDGVIDGSGTHFVNVPTPLVTRDNLRQGAVDLLALTRSLPNLDVTGDGAGDIDPTRIHFVGHSLGGIVGGVYLGSAGAAELTTSELAMPGGGVAQTIFDSPAFGPRIKQGLAAQGITEGSTIYNQFIRDAQTIVDAGDPVNYIAAAAAARPLLVLQVVGGGTLANGSPSPPDQVVVNSATKRLIDAAALPRVFAAGLNAGPNGYVNFIFGDHGSIISPTASLATTTEMQTETIGFANSSGAVIPILNPAVVQQ